MGLHPRGWLDAATSRAGLARVSEIAGRLTCRLSRGTTEETLTVLDQRWGVNAQQWQMLAELDSTKAGSAFVDQKIQDINRAAFHRSAFALNALTQLLFVDLPAQLLLSFPQLKLGLVAANLLLVWIAHASMRANFSALLAGPQALPPKRRCWGLLANPRYNKAVKKHSRPHARDARKEKSLYRSAYVLNALSIFVGSQFVLPAERLIFPFSFIVDKVTGLITTLVMIFDVWRAIRAGDDARIAGEREIAVYRDLDV